jgi:hypothetical protein
MTKESKESREHEKKQDELIEQLVARTGLDGRRFWVATGATAL